MLEQPRQERAVRTRLAILRAAVSVLVERGHAGTTMQRVQDRAEVSRGTLTHHFASISSLLAAAIHYIAERQVAELDAVIAAEPAPASARDVVRLLHPFMSGTLFIAGLELWSAARTSAELQAELLPAERELGKHLRRHVQGHLSDVDFGMLLALFRGLAVTSVLRTDPAKAQAELERWASLVDGDRAGRDRA